MHRMHRSLHDDAALAAVVSDELSLARSRRRKTIRDELSVAEGATSRALAQAAGRRAKQSAVAVGTAGVLLAPGMTGVAAADDTAPSPEVAQPAVAAATTAPAQSAPPAESTDAGEAAPVTDVTPAPAAPAPPPPTDAPVVGSPDDGPVGGVGENADRGAHKGRGERGEENEGG
ncbi:hypothetical protein BH23ACT9_BH23ACT9_10780 [soil metagenome]